MRRIAYVLVFFACGAFAGANLACYLRRNPPEGVSAELQKPAEAAVPEEVDRIAELRGRLARLEAKLAEKGDKPAEPAEPAAEADEGRPKSVFAGRLAHMLKMRDEDPKQFAYATNRADCTTRWIQQQVKVRGAYFNRADTARMTEAERAVHEEILACLEAVGEISEISRQWDRADEVEAARSAEDRAVRGRLAELYADEARTLSRLKALDLGFAEADAEEIADSVSQVLRATYNTTTWTGLAN